MNQNLALKIIYQLILKHFFRDQPHKMNTGTRGLRGARPVFSRTMWAKV